MCTATELATAATRMQKSTRIKRSDAARVDKIAKAMRRNKATTQQIAWAKRIAAGFLG